MVQSNTTPKLRLKNLCAQNTQVWMGIVNLSPQSFSVQTASTTSELYHASISKILKHSHNLVQNGAHILDVGAVPSNPAIANALIESEAELDILYPVLKAIKKEFGSTIMVSVDTYSPTVAHTLATEHLLDIVNDIYGGRKTENIIFDKNSSMTEPMNLIDVVAKFSLGYVLMHMSGELDSLPKSNDVTNASVYLNDVLNFFKERKEILTQKGIDFCLFDPGIGGGRFGKNLDVNLALLSEDFLEKLSQFGFPILVGLSRKSFLKDLHPECTTPLSRDLVSKEWEYRCFERGVKIIRTHCITKHHAK